MIINLYCSSCFEGFLETCGEGFFHHEICWHPWIGVAPSQNGKLCRRTTRCEGTAFMDEPMFGHKSKGNTPGDWVPIRAYTDGSLTVVHDMVDVGMTNSFGSTPNTTNLTNETVLSTSDSWVSINKPSAIHHWKAFGDLCQPSKYPGMIIVKMVRHWLAIDNH